MAAAEELLAAAVTAVDVVSAVVLAPLSVEVVFATATEEEASEHTIRLRQKVC